MNSGDNLLLLLAVPSSSTGLAGREPTFKHPDRQLPDVDFVLAL